MHSNKNRTQHRVFNRGFVCLLCMLVVVACGCEPLRKKFTRKKKEENKSSGKFIPVLDPIDYPEKIYSVESEYKHHYSLWQVWEKDLLQVIDGNGSDKRQKYLLGQVIDQVQEMQGRLEGAQQAELSALVSELQAILDEEYSKSSSVRNKFSTRKRIEYVSKEIRANFSPKKPLPYRN